MLPNFLVIGAKKAGTTSVHRYLATHPEVFVPAEKGLHFFSGPTWDRGVAWYESRFDTRARAVGEVSTTYARHPVHPDVPERVAAVLPEAHLVYLLRHPLDRIESHYRQAVAEWGERRPILDAVLGNPGEFLGPSRYATQIERYLEHFPRERLFVTTAEELRAHPAATLSRLFAFLGVDPTWAPPNAQRRFNRADDHRDPSSAVRRLRALPAYRAVRSRVPAGVRSAAWRLGSRPVRHDPSTSTLQGDDRAAVLDRLMPDLERLGPLVSDGFDCWGLLDP